MNSHNFFFFLMNFQFQINYHLKLNYMQNFRFIIYIIFKNIFIYYKEIVIFIFTKFIIQNFKKIFTNSLINIFLKVPKIIKGTNIFSREEQSYNDVIT